MILVTGGTGMLGSRLVLDLISSGKRVRVLKRSGTDLSEIENFFRTHLSPGATSSFSDVEWIEGDLLDVTSLYNAMHGVSSVYHCAAIVSFNPALRKKMMRVNAEGTANVVNAALESGVKKLCHVSSIAAIGRAEEGMITEETKWTDTGENSVYAQSKHLAEREVWRGIAEGLDAVIVNPSIIIGPAHGKGISTKMFQQVWKGLKFYTEGVNGFVDVRDVSSAMILLMENSITNQRFILNSENYSYRELFNRIAFCLGKPKAHIKVSNFTAGIAWRAAYLGSLLTGNRPFITKETARTSMRCYFYSSEKFRELTGMKFIPVKQSIEDACRVFLEQKKS